MATIRRNKSGRIAFATTLTGTLVTGWVPDDSLGAVMTDDEARAVVEGYKARDADRTGQIAAVDAKGKTIAMWGEQGAAPEPVKPPVNLPDVAAKVDLLEERVELIEASEADTPNVVQFTAEEAAALKGMLGEWAVHKKSQAEKAVA